MKKLLVLSALLGLLVLPVFADHVSIDMGGDSTFGFIGDFGDNEAENTDLTWDVIVGIDDYNSFTWSLAGLDTAPAISLDKALVTTDVGMWLGLPVGLKVMWGWDDPDANEFAVTTGYENEQVYDFSPVLYWGFDFLLSASMFEVEVAFDPGISGGAGDFGHILAGVAIKEPVPGLNAEVYWWQGGTPTLTDEFDAGQIGFGASYETEVSGIGLDAGASFLYDTDDTATEAWVFGLGVAVDVTMFHITAGIHGDETDTLSSLSATAEVSPVDMATLYVGMLMDLSDAAAETLQEVDLGVNAHIGAVEAYLGYVVTSVGSGDNYNSPAGIPDGGAYLKFDVNY
jgi:hypothetical protein